MPGLDEFVFAPDQEPERVYLMGLGLPGVSGTKLEEQMAELAELAVTAGAEVVGSDVQHLERANPTTIFGKGKVDELKSLKGDLDFTTVITNDELAPRQQRNLEDAMNMKVLDRTELILDIFARHARSHEGRLQVEAAQLRHLLPRLAGGRNLSRLGGGIGTRGPGEQKLEVDRRRIRHRISQLKAEIAKLEKSRGLHRQARRRAEVPVVAVVGYTNSGKSTLMNALTGAGVLEADQLFATLDPTTRAVELPDGRRVLLTDTVGFIQKLPTDLVAAFRATLEEVTEADLILHVLDASHPAMRDHFDATNDVLDDLEAMDKPLVLAFNKCDLLDAGTVAMIRRRGDWSPYEEVVPISARTGLGLPGLLEAIERQTRLNLVELDLLVPYDHAGVESELRQHGRVLKLDYVEDGIRIAAEVPGNLAPRFAEFAKTPAG
ncbi:MAG TPA: GTPase HflX [Candidatus Solibacter sp.]|jgi:GTP-binding protein HflX|nr:GTPase HflX [Candidatus Solibacter sp.]